VIIDGARFDDFEGFEGFAREFTTHLCDTASGSKITATNAGYDAAIAANGGTASFAFNGTWTNANERTDLLRPQRNRLLHGLKSDTGTRRHRARIRR
jgi:hypothetical protein